MNTILGVDIGSFNIKIVEVVQDKGKFEMVNYGITRTPDSAVNDGRIMDVDKIYSELVQLIKKTGVKARQAVCMVSSSGLVTREVNIPKMKESDLAKYIQIDSQQYFPVNLDDYTLDFKILSEVKGQEGMEYMVLLAAIPELIVNNYIKLFDRLKIDLLAIDIIPNLLSKLAQNYLLQKQSSLNTIAIIDLGADSTIVNIMSNGVLQFSRMIPSGSNGFTQSISNSFNLTIPEAEEFKIKNAEIVLDAYGTESLGSNISEIIKPLLDGIASYVNKFLEFYYSRNSNNKINAIYLTGGGALLKGIDQYFQTTFNIPTRLISLADGITNKSSIPTVNSDITIIANAFGLTNRSI